MATSPTWQRIYRQTLILIYKNLLIFYGAPISTLARAVVFPIVFTTVMCVLQNVNPSSLQDSINADGTISPSPSPIQDLGVAIRSSSSQRLVFVRNGLSTELLNPVLDGILQQPSLEGLDIQVTDNADDLFTLCPQSVWGMSNCFAAAIFVALNSTTVDYIVALDSQLVAITEFSSASYNDTILSTRVLPLQWAIESQVGNLSSSSKPFEQSWEGFFFSQLAAQNVTPKHGPLWLALVGMFVAPFFILILVGVGYHIAVFVATERQTGLADLQRAQMVTDAPRIISTVLSFLILYFPGFLVSSILLTQLLFTNTSDILFLLLTLLAGISITISSHFLASFFGKAQLAGLYISTFIFALSLVSYAASLLSSSPYNEIATSSVAAPTSYVQILILSLIFPPYTWATLIGDVANREFELNGLSLSPVGPQTLEELALGITPQQSLQGYLYLIFFIVQIVVYSAATYWIERTLWGVKRNFEPLEASSDVAIRVTNLSKTYFGKRPWYWPFRASGVPTLAVRSLDLEVKKGSVTFLLGPNGGGKTTTLKCVAGMTAMDSGSRLEINEAGTVFGICPQHNVFWANLTVEQHIKIWRKLKTAAFEDVVSDDDDVLGECDLLEKVKARASTLSGGQMRKLQLAISFVGGSSVCCIDEASSGLDPLSRRNIWNIIQKGHARRTVLVTTHFLDEADILADKIAIMYQGQLVCEGPGPSLKARFGGDYIIRSESIDDDETMVWRTSNSAEATRKILELEALTDDHTYNVVFPTLEQVFLKVTSDSNTAIHENSGDGIVGEETTIDEKIFSVEAANARDIDLDVGHYIGVGRQILTLFRKRYTLLLQRSGWISYGINLIIPIIIGAVLAFYLPRMHSLQTCQQNVFLQQSQSGSDFAPLTPPSPFAIIQSSPNSTVALLGPPSAFTGAIQDDLYVNEIGPLISSGRDPSTFDPLFNNSFNQTLSTRVFLNDTSQITGFITNSSNTDQFYGFGIWAPSPDSTILFHDSEAYNAQVYMSAFSYITNRLANNTQTGTARVCSASLRTFTQISDNVSFWNMPIAIILVLAFLAAASIAVIYPAFEKVNRVRALHYCNGVSPFALWFGYLLFDIQLIIIQASIVWGIAFAGSLSRLYYMPVHILGVLILFGIATYLGTYFLSLFVKKAAFAVAAGIHLLLFVLYLVGYVVNQAVGNAPSRFRTYSLLQYFLGLTSPAANLARALFVSMNVFGVLCGEFGNDESSPMAYHRYGSVYANLLIQIALLITLLVVYEYGSADWVRRHITRRSIPDRLHYMVDSDQVQEEKNARASAMANPAKVLSVSHVSKFFGRTFAAQNISFDISSNETLALLGANGAGKTTMINLIRGDLKPNFGDITLEGISVLRQPHKARMLMGVCPQDDAVDNLTVRQTLSFYASVKGLKNISGNVDKVLNALNIAIYEKVMVKALSGGTKRKLSVAIALLGNPRILLLDEPSTGQDAGAKRLLWKALQDISANRAILLTTHSMEEAEALATNVAIMGTRMLATGTLSSLQDEHGGLYSVRAVRMPEASSPEVERLVKEGFDDRVVNYEDRHGQVSFYLPHDKAALGSIMKIMEILKGNAIGEQGSHAVGGSSGAMMGIKVLQDYTVNGPTLEEVFINVSRESGTARGV